MKRDDSRRHPANSLGLRRVLRRKATAAETVLWRLLRSRRLAEFKFRRQHPIGGYIVDFCCVRYRLAVEIDGDSHFIADGPARDERRSGYIESAGYNMMRFTNREVLENEAGVLQAIYERLSELRDAEPLGPSP